MWVFLILACRAGSAKASIKKTHMRPGGFEPPTNSLEGCCSIHLSYGRLSFDNNLTRGAIRRVRLAARSRALLARRLDMVSILRHAHATLVRSCDGGHPSINLLRVAHGETHTASAAPPAAARHLHRNPDEPSPDESQSVAVLTQHNDNTRSGWNDKETALTTSNVNVQQFGAVFTLAVDDQVYAQPLVVGHVSVGGGDRNVVYIATVNNMLYAYDGDNGRLYWQRGFTAPGMRPPTRTDMTGACGGSYQDFSGNIGIVGTPVIDAARGTMYFVARSTTGTTFVQHLHAVNIVDGSEIAGSPTAITPTYSGNGDGSVTGVIAFDAQRQNQRQGLTLLNGVVYVTFSSHCDWGPYHGWILGYEAATLQQQVVYNATPNGYAGGMWESGTGMAADATGNLYVVTGNGTVGDSTDPTSPTNRAESALKLTPAGSTLHVASYFTPQDFQYLNDNDLDYGTMGGFLIPNSL